MPFGGASVSFMQPFRRDRALALWGRIARGLERDGHCDMNYFDRELAD
jgi:hypothetical protein